MSILIFTLFSAIIGFGTAFYIEKKIRVKLQRKSQRALGYVAMISFAVGFTGLINELLSHPMLGLAIRYDKVMGYLLANMIIIPAFFYFLAWILGFFGSASKNNESESKAKNLKSVTEEIEVKKVQNEMPINNSILTDEEMNVIYAEAFDEAETGNVDKGLWARCFASADGDSNQSKAKYIELRVATLTAIAIEKKRASNISEVIDSLIRRSDGGDTYALVELAKIKYEGLYNQEKRLVEALDYLKRASLLGNATAQNMLSLMHWKGEGTSKNKSYAHAWAVIASSKLSEAKSNVAIFQREMTSEEVYQSDDLVKSLTRAITANGVREEVPSNSQAPSIASHTLNEANDKTGLSSNGNGGKYWFIGLGLLAVVFMVYKFYEDYLSHNPNFLSFNEKKIYDFYPHTVWDNCNSPYVDKPLMSMEFMYNSQSKEIIARIDYDDKGVKKQDYTKLEPCTVFDEKNWSCGGNVLSNGRDYTSKYIMTDGRFSYEESSYAKCRAKIVAR